MDEHHQLLERVDLGRLAKWLNERDLGAGVVQRLTAERIGTTTGIANALFLIRAGDQRWVLRRPPAVKNTPSASNMSREYRVLRALEGTPVPHPRPIAICEDPAVLGAVFLLMDLVDGFTPVDPLPPPFDTDGRTRHGIGLALVDGIAELSLVDWRAAGLEGFGKPDGFLERQVGRWLGQFETYRTRDIPEMDFVATWLDEHRPTMGPAGIVHGDFSLYNVMLAHDAPPRLAAIIDWDTSTIGDPLMDLGLLLARWNHVGEAAVGVSDIDDRIGLATRDELAERYSRRTGRDVSRIEYYEVLSLFKLACILEGNYGRALRSEMPDESMVTRLVDLIPGLIRSAATIARSARWAT